MIFFYVQLIFVRKAINFPYNGNNRRFVAAIPTSMYRIAMANCILTMGMIVWNGVGRKCKGKQTYRPHNSTRGIGI